MSKEPIFLDTSFVLALLNRRDQHHAKAKFLSSHLQIASEIWLRSEMDCLPLIAKEQQNLLKNATKHRK